MTGRFEAVLFDLGNTLLHFDGAWPEVFQSADQQLLAYLHSRGLELDEVRFLSLFRNRLNDYYRERESEFIEHTSEFILQQVLAELGYPEVADDLLSPALESLYEISQAHWQPEKDALPTVKKLHANGYKLGVISNASNDADVQALVDKAEVRPYMDFVLSSAAFGMRKPNPGIFRHALELIRIAADRAVMVGDTLGADILGAKNAGLFAIWITRRADTPANHDHADTIYPDATIERLAELPALLGQF